MTGKHQRAKLWCVLLATGVVWLAPGGVARADLDVEAAVVGGTGFGKAAADRPYTGLVGLDAGLIISGFYAGVRWMRSFHASKDVLCTDCTRIGALTSIGADLGYEWELWLLHLGPKVGVGFIREKHADPDVRGVYIDPGAAAELEIGWFIAGVDLRYRLVPKESDANGTLLFGRVGLRF